MYANMNMYAHNGDLYTQTNMYTCIPMHMNMLHICVLICRHMHTCAYTCPCIYLFIYSM